MSINLTNKSKMWKGWKTNYFVFNTVEVIQRGKIYGAIK